MATVGELIEELQKYPKDMMVVYFVKRIRWDGPEIFSNQGEKYLLKVLPSDDPIDEGHIFLNINTMKHGDVKRRGNEIIEVLAIE